VQRMVHQFKATVAAMLGRSGVLRMLHRMRRPHVLVLAYHRVTPDEDVASCAYPAMHVSTSSFDAQLAALAELYRIVPLRDLGPILAGTLPLREHVAVITFDDGYRDNYRNALPILAAHNVAATFFVSVDFVDRGESFWFDRVAAAARAWSANVTARATITGLPAEIVSAFDSPGSLAERARLAAAFLKTLPDDERQRWVRALEPLAQGAASEDAPMQWDEVRALRQAGMSIGAHGVRHGILTRMPGEEAAREIGDSVSLIGQRVGAPVETFAYPNGDVDDAVADLARRAGVRLGFTMAGRNVGPGIDALRIARRNVCEDTSRGRDGRFSAAYFWCEITGVFDVLAGRLLRRG